MSGRGKKGKVPAVPKAAAKDEASEEEEKRSGVQQVPEVPQDVQDIVEEIHRLVLQETAQTLQQEPQRKEQEADQERLSFPSARILIDGDDEPYVFLPVIKIDPNHITWYIFDYKIYLELSGVVLRGRFEYELWEHEPFARFTERVRRKLNSDAVFHLSYYRFHEGSYQRFSVMNNVDFVQLMIWHGVFQNDQMAHTSVVILILGMPEKFCLSLLCKRRTERIINITPGQTYALDDFYQRDVSSFVLRNLPDLSATRNVPLKLMQVLSTFYLRRLQMELNPPPVPPRRGETTPIVPSGPGQPVDKHPSDCQCMPDGSCRMRLPPVRSLSPTKMSAGQRKKLKQKAGIEKFIQTRRESSMRSSTESQSGEDAMAIERRQSPEIILSSFDPASFRGTRSIDRRPEDDIPGPSNRPIGGDSPGTYCSSSTTDCTNIIDKTIEVTMKLEAIRQQSGLRNRLEEVCDPEELLEVRDVQSAILGSLQTAAATAPSSSAQGSSRQEPQVRDVQPANRSSSQTGAETAPRIIARGTRRLHPQLMVVPPPELMGSSTWERESHPVIVIDSEDRRFMRDARTGGRETSDDGEGCSSGIQTGSLGATPKKKRVVEETSVLPVDSAIPKPATSNSSDSERKDSSASPLLLSKSQKKRAKKAQKLKAQKEQQAQKEKDSSDSNN